MTSLIFQTLAEAERHLLAQGFRLLPNSCDWVDASGLIDAGIYPETDSRGNEVYRIEYRA